ncbi:unnamed protein product [Schistosoma margrebowiei]|uniref:Uncharacterized protein n=1 Tax=Schistosoma margrebowiei TaxID=48269 RepID=A0A3P7ZL08_9TREM|nr:unnamed protein product [Schistosoma margrebowiei]
MTLKKGRYNELIGFGKLRETANEFKVISFIV